MLKGKSGEIMNDQEKLRDHLKKEVADRSLSLRELGRLSGIDHATLSKIMNGKRKMNLNHLHRLSEGLDISLKSLLSVSENHDVASENHDVADDDLDRNLEAVQRLVKANHPEMDDITLARVDLAIEKYAADSMTPRGRQDIHEKLEDKMAQSSETGIFMNNIRSMYNKFITMDGHPRDIALMGGALLYFIVTTDLIPDYLLPIGLLDDALIVQAISQRVENRNLLM